MRTVLLDAKAQIKEPISKMHIAAKNVPLILSGVSKNNKED
jgi:hypothetical protein